MKGGVGGPVDSILSDSEDAGETARKDGVGSKRTRGRLSAT